MSKPQKMIMPNPKGCDYGCLCRHEIITDKQTDAFRAGYDCIDWGKKDSNEPNEGDASLS